LLYSESLTKSTKSTSASKPIDLGLGFQVHWVHIKLGFPQSCLVGTLNV
jgi:hypothetical protein